MQFEGVLIAVLVVLYMLGAGIKALFRWATGEAQREREQVQRQQEEDRRQKDQREREEAAERQAVEDAKKQFGQAIMNGEIPSAQVLSVLRDSYGHIPENIKEAFEELLYGSCTLRSISYREALRLIRQRGRINDRAQQRAGRVGLPSDDPNRPLGEPEAFALLGVAQDCTPDELAHAYHQKMSQWHPDKLDSMSQELKDYATRHTVRINEAYQKLKSMTVQNRGK